MKRVVEIYLWPQAASRGDETRRSGAAEA